MNVYETVLNIGRPTPLIGILTEADTGTNRHTALILLNSGIMHRVGACRLSVNLARNVAAQTRLPCVRFDFSGVGDSDRRSGSGLDFEEGAVAETIEVMDHMQKIRGIQRFILYGLCSGARIASATAERDGRITGIVQVDGPCYPTPAAYLHYYVFRLFGLVVWRARLSRWRRGKTTANRGVILNRAKPDFEVPEFAEDPGREIVAHQLHRLMNKNVQLGCIFTGRDLDYAYRKQFEDCFEDVEFGDNLRVEYYPNASHILTEPEYQRRMISTVTEWIDAMRRHGESPQTGFGALDREYDQVPT